LCFEAPGFNVLFGRCDCSGFFLLWTQDTFRMPFMLAMVHPSAQKQSSERSHSVSSDIPKQLQGGSWSSVTGKTYDPSGLFGAGTFRLVIDNRQNPKSTSYSGSYVVPM
jgi:hypothetical protein